MKNKMNFNDAMAELEEINTWFETNEIDLDESIVKYERAAELISFCQDRLKSTKNRFIEINNKIVEKDDLELNNQLDR